MSGSQPGHRTGAEEQAGGGPRSETDPRLLLCLRGDRYDPQVSTTTSQAQARTERECARLIVHWLQAQPKFPPPKGDPVKRRVSHRCDPQVASSPSSSARPSQGAEVDLLSGESPQFPRTVLHRRTHLTYLLNMLEYVPSSLCSLDASQTWIMFWVLHSLDLLGHAQHLPLHTQNRCIDTLLRAQNPTGGFGGGSGQQSHAATTYAAVMALSILYGACGNARGLQGIDRRALRSFFQRLRVPCGEVDLGRESSPARGTAFRMSIGGEADTRAMYCVLAVATLLGVCDSQLVGGCARWLSACQGFDGGIAGEPCTEAHGGYAFCGLAAALMLQGVPGSQVLVGQVFDLRRLLHWAASRQMTVEGGFQGRTNKLVDSCYSFWVGGMFPLLHGLLTARSLATGRLREAPGEGPLFDGLNLQKYVLCVAQLDNAMPLRKLSARPSLSQRATRGVRKLLGMGSAGGERKTDGGSGCRYSSGSYGEWCQQMDETDAQREEDSDSEWEAAGTVHHRANSEPRTPGSGMRGSSVSSDRTGTALSGTHQPQSTQPQCFQFACDSAAGSTPSGWLRPPHLYSRRFAYFLHLLHRQCDACFCAVRCVCGGQQARPGSGRGERLQAPWGRGDCGHVTWKGRFYVPRTRWALIQRHWRTMYGGGLRDKPGKPFDPYHTCYALSGLSVAQHVASSEVAYMSLMEEEGRTQPAGKTGAPGQSPSPSQSQSQSQSQPSQSQSQESHNTSTQPRNTSTQSSSGISRTSPVGRIPRWQVLGSRANVLNPLNTCYNLCVHSYVNTLRFFRSQTEQSK